MVEKKRYTEDDIIYWSADDGEEVLHCRSEEEAIDEFMDNIWPFIAIENLNFPEKISLFGYIREEINPVDYYGEWLNRFLEVLDEEYGDIYSDARELSPITDGMKKSEKDFIDTVLKEYVPYTCKRVVKKEVKVEDFLDRDRIEEIKEEWEKERDS